MVNESVSEYSSSINSYFRDISKYSSLSLEREKELGILIQNYQGFEGPHTLEQTARYIRAKEELVCSNLRLVAFIAHRFVKNKSSLPDLISKGNQGLIHAAEMYDPSFGTKFSYYASFFIKNELFKETISNQRGDIRVPVGSSYKIGLVERTKLAFKKEFNRLPTKEELSELTGYSIKTLDSLPERFSQSSLDQQITDGEEGTYLDIIPDSKTPSPFDSLLENEQKELLFKILDTLGERERYILTRSFGLDGEPPGTLEEISSHFGCTRERIRQIRIATIKNLREIYSPGERVSSSKREYRNNKHYSQTNSSKKDFDYLSGVKKTLEETKPLSVVGFIPKRTRGRPRKNLEEVSSESTYKHLSEAEKKQIIAEYYQPGASSLKVGKIFGRSYKTILNVWREAGLKRPKGRRRLEARVIEGFDLEDSSVKSFSRDKYNGKEENLQILKYYQESYLSASEVGKHFGYSSRTILKILKEGGLKIRKGKRKNLEKTRPEKKSCLGHNFLGKEEREKIIEAYYQPGASSLKVGKIFGRSYKTILRTWKKAGLPSTRGRNRLEKIVIENPKSTKRSLALEQQQNIYALRQQGKSVEELSELFGCSPSKIYYTLKKYKPSNSPSSNSNLSPKSVLDNSFHKKSFEESLRDYLGNNFSIRLEGNIAEEVFQSLSDREKYFILSYLSGIYLGKNHKL